MTGLVTTAGLQFQDWTADYRLYSRRRAEPSELLGVLRRHVAGQHPARPIVVALDDTRAEHAGRKIPGAKYTRDPMGPAFHVNFIRANRFLQLSMAYRTGPRSARMIPVDFTHAPTPVKPSAKATAQQWADYRGERARCKLPLVAAGRLHHLRTRLDSEGHHRRPLWAVGDGGYTNSTLLRRLPRRTDFIGRIRSDAKLYALPQSNRLGRRRIYGAALPTPEEIRQDDNTPWQQMKAYACGREHTFRIKTLDAVRWRASGDRTLRLIIIAPLAYRLCAGQRLLYRRPAYLICTDPQAPLEEVLQAYLWRWDIEVNFRDEKSLLGIAEAKVRDPDSVETVPALGVAAYGLLMVAGLDEAACGRHPNTLPLPKWRANKPRPLCAGQLIAALRHELWRDAIRKTDFVSSSSHHTNCTKSKPALDSAVFYAVNSG